MNLESGCFGLEKHVCHNHQANDNTITNFIALSEASVIVQLVQSYESQEYVGNPKEHKHLTISTMKRPEKRLEFLEFGDASLFTKPNGSRLNDKSQYDKYHADVRMWRIQMGTGAKTRHNNDPPAR
jgi:hypothetical protein